MPQHPHPDAAKESPRSAEGSPPAMEDFGARAAALCEQLSTTFAELDGFQTLIQQRVSELNRQEAEAADREVTLARREQELVAQQEALTQTETEIEQRRAEIERQAGELDERSAALDARHHALEEHAAELASKETEIERMRQEMEAQQQAIEAGRAEITELSEKFTKEKESFASTIAEIDSKKAEIEQEYERLVELEGELAKREESLREQTEQIESCMQDLARREQAVGKFQSAFQHIAAAFSTELPKGLLGDADSPGGGEAAGVAQFAAAMANAASPQTAALLAQATQPIPSHDAAHSDAGAGDEPPVEATTVNAEALTPPAARKRANAKPVPVAAPDARTESEPDGGSIDERGLDPEEVKKLKVMRRLTGGRISDHELLRRIRNESGGTPPTEMQSKPKKKSWWKS